MLLQNYYFSFILGHVIFLVHGVRKYNRALYFCATYFCSKTVIIFTGSRFFKVVRVTHNARCHRALVLNSTSPESHVSLFELPFAGQGESQVTLKLEMAYWEMEHN